MVREAARLVIQAAKGREWQGPEAERDEDCCWSTRGEEASDGGVPSLPAATGPRGIFLPQAASGRRRGQEQQAAASKCKVAASATEPNGPGTIKRRHGGQ
ncbi:hypothetical protein CDD83_1796 [Cordyceps sp. RAO-2017]|nr:hypothetical protein CDD83_1796 [Cordyceps sp. RAO-2017]